MTDYVLLKYKIPMSYRILALFCFLIFAGTFVRDIDSVNVNKYIFVFITVLAYLILDENGMVSFIAFMIPFFIGLPSNYIVGLAVIFLLIKLKTFRLSLFAFAPYCFLIIELTHLFYPSSSLGQFVVFSVHIMLITFILLKKNANYDNKMVLLSYGMGVIASFTVILINTLQFVPFSLLMQRGIRIGNVSWVDKSLNPDLMMLSTDQNTLGYLCAIAVAGFLVLLSARKLSLKVALPLILLTIVYGSITLSRTFVLVLIGVLVLYLISNLKLNPKNSKNAISFLFMTFVVGFVMKMYFPSTLNLIVKRFSDPNNLTGGRGPLFQSYNSFGFANIGRFLFGVGLQNQNIKSGIPGVPHNGPQQVFVAGGIVGLVLIVTWIIGMYVNYGSVKNDKFRLVNCLPLITLIIYVQALQFLSPYIIMLPLIVSFCALRVRDDSVNDSHHLPSAYLYGPKRYLANQVGAGRTQASRVVREHEI